MRMKALTRKAVDEELGDYLTTSEREALMARRDALVSVGRVARADGAVRPQHVPPIAANRAAGVEAVGRPVFTA